MNRRTAKWTVWRGDQVIGATETATAAKAYAKRSAGLSVELFRFGREKPEYQAMLSVHTKARWEECA